MTEQLKPCPFCGSEDIKRYGGGYAQEAPVTVCKNCHAECLGHELWNNRPAENKLKADAIREAIAVIDEMESPEASDFLEYADQIERGEV